MATGSTTSPASSVPVGDLRGDLHRVEPDHADADVRVRLVEARDQPGQQVVVGVAQHAEGRDPAAQRLHRAQCAAGIVGGRHRLLGVRHELLPGGGQHQTGGRPRWNRATSCSCSSRRTSSDTAAWDIAFAAPRP